MILLKAIFLLHVSLAIGLTLDNLPHRLDVPSSNRFDHYNQAEDGFDGEFIQSVPPSKRQLDRFGSEYKSKSSSFSKDDGDHEALWEKPYAPLHRFRDHVKREIKGQQGFSKEKDDQELVNILQDDETEKNAITRDRKVPPDAMKRKASGSKKKRESETLPEFPTLKENKENDHDSPDFQEWLRREYYRNMAKSFASMRRKRAMWGPIDADIKQVEHRRMAPPARAVPTKTKKDVRFDDVTDSLKSIEDVLLADALKVIKESGGDYDDDSKARRRVANDLSAAYDIETMRAALFRLRDTFYGMDEEDNEARDMAAFRKYKKRVAQLDSLPPLESRDSSQYHSPVEQCPPLAVLTSDCAALGDTIPDDSLKELLSHACNWHEVCYSCGEVFGLSSDNCDMGFVEQSRTICRGDIPCESTAKLLLLPLRQRRVFYKRSNPNVCLVDQCVEDFLTHG